MMRILITCFFALASVARCSVVPEAYSVVPETTFAMGGKGEQSKEKDTKRLQALTFPPTPPMDTQATCMVTFTKTNSNCQNVSIVPFESCVCDSSLASMTCSMMHFAGRGFNLPGIYPAIVEVLRIQRIGRGRQAPMGSRLQECESGGLVQHQVYHRQQV